MGDRGNIRIAGVYLYTHWGGSELKQTLQDALKKHWRWNDEAYLARIIFCEMVKDDSMGETGFGISSEMPDNEHEIVCVDCEKQTVREGNKTWSFEEFVAKKFGGG